MIYDALDAIIGGFMDWVMLWIWITLIAVLLGLIGFAAMAAMMQFLD